jgi:hypothetical protein
VGQNALAVLTAAHDQAIQCWRALHKGDVHDDAQPSSAPGPLVWEAADPVISHGVTLSRDRAMNRSTASHAGSLPKVPPTGRPPDRNDRPLGATICTALSARYDSADSISAPTEAPTASPSTPSACSAPLLLDPVRASARNTGSNCNAQCPTGCSRPYLPIQLADTAIRLGPMMGRRALDTPTGGGEGNTTLAVTPDSKQPPTSAPTAAPGGMSSLLSWSSPIRQPRNVRVLTGSRAVLTSLCCLP